MNITLRWSLLTAFVLTVILPGCAGTRTGAGAPSPSAAAVDGRGLAVFRGGDGGPMAWAELVSRAADAEVVVVGETHWNASGQAFEAALYEDVLAAAPAGGGTGGAAAALEFIERDEQAAVDDYLSGVIGAAELERIMDPTGSNRSPGHRAIVEASKRSGRPVIAANSPRRYTTLARRAGYERLSQLSAEQRRLFRVPDALPTGRYFEDFARIMASGGSLDEQSAAARAPVSQEQLERARPTFRAQSLWDWTMADSVVQGLDRGWRPVVLIVGRFHSEREGGVVEALRRLRPGVRVLTITLNDTVASPPRNEDLDLADVIVPLPRE